VKEYGVERSKDLFLWLKPGESANYPEGREDDTHFSAYGARAMASLVLQGILESVPSLAEYVMKAPGGVQSDADVATAIGGPHKGGGQATDYWFFKGAVAGKFIFRKIVLQPGSAIGYHLHDKDEIYYILDGKGKLLLNGEISEVGPGTAIFARPGDSHGLKQIGEADLTIIVVYENKD
jgi:mannose-6-phosphate isomerase-like protein (cupin superfamily)